MFLRNQGNCYTFQKKVGFVELLFRDQRQLKSGSRCGKTPHMDNCTDTMCSPAMETTVGKVPSKLEESGIRLNLTTGIILTVSGISLMTSSQTCNKLEIEH